MAEIVVYTSEPSEVCGRVKNVLSARGFEFQEIDVQTDAERAAMVERTGLKHCPVVLVGDAVIGGLAETIEAVKSGRLVELVAGE